MAAKFSGYARAKRAYQDHDLQHVAEGAIVALTDEQFRDLRTCNCVEEISAEEVEKLSKKKAG